MDDCMKIYVTLLVQLAVMLSVATVAGAVPVGRDLEWASGSSTIVFSGALHAGKGYTCNDCHPVPFLMKKTAGKMKMAEINAGQYCGACHDGEKAFSSKKLENCIKCHTWK